MNCAERGEVGCDEGIGFIHLQDGAEERVEQGSHDGVQHQAVVTA